MLSAEQLQALNGFYRVAESALISSLDADSRFHRLEPGYTIPGGDQFAAAAHGHDGALYLFDVAGTRSDRWQAKMKRYPGLTVWFFEEFVTQIRGAGRDAGKIAEAARRGVANASVVVISAGKAVVRKFADVVSGMVVETVVAAIAAYAVANFETLMALFR